MVERNLQMYDIAVGEHPELHIPFFSFRGTPTGIDIFRVLETGVTPVMDIGIAGKDGGQIGGGLVMAHRTCFERAPDAYHKRYDA